MRFRVSFFFFSSRRRHTRLQGDWSSDVCSSDLQVLAERGLEIVSLHPFLQHRPRHVDILPEGIHVMSPEEKPVKEGSLPLGRQGVEIVSGRHKTSQRKCQYNGVPNPVASTILSAPRGPQPPVDQAVALRVLNSYLSMRTAAPAPSERTTRPNATNWSGQTPPNRAGQFTESSMSRPCGNSPSVVKKTPPLLMSIVLPVPCMLHDLARSVRYRTSSRNGNRPFPRRSDAPSKWAVMSRGAVMLMFHNRRTRPFRQ